MRSFFIAFGSALISAFVYSDLNYLDIGIGIDNRNRGELAKTSWEYAKASTTQRSFEDGFAQALLRVDGSEDLFSLSRSNVVYLTNFETRAIGGRWPLTRWNYLSPPIGIAIELSELGHKSFRSQINQNSDVRIPGCLNQSPLRYGDIENDGASEIVLTLNSELIVFSPEHQRIIFAAMPYADDWNRSGNYDGLVSAVDGEHYQYASAQLAVVGFVHRAHRAYSKIYDADFDEDGNFDLIVWQKTYRSNKVGEVDGFQLIRSKYMHFERDLHTGEYLPQDTSEQIIKNWLAEGNLTWSKGYPSISECPGEEGQLIPEMHDPFLNDPDVLQ